ncbi:hypothetical protein EVAR_94852_1 [Eumeta japonica]|uniref:Retrovirus-related Pol polyprotein from transposon opus n=1 Tax=Eumeta variegata TaxID=151549 RepID=A0A4C1VAL7_EUMVA|nr:hypothetical protein EVAR_94852_1 [Eumeta japonica]
MREYGMLINTSKCVFGADNVTFLGYNISAKGKATGTKVESIKNFPIPKTVKELRRFLGMINFYRRFIPDAARIQAPLNALLTDCDAKLSLVTDASDTSLGAVLQQYKDKAWEP